MQLYYLRSGLTGKVIGSNNLDMLVKVANKCEGLIITLPEGLTPDTAKPTDYSIVYSYGESAVIHPN